MIENLALAQISLYLSRSLSLKDLQRWLAQHVVEQDLPLRASATLDALDVLLMELGDGALGLSEFELELSLMLSEDRPEMSSSAVGSDRIAELSNSSTVGEVEADHVTVSTPLDSDLVLFG